MTDNTKPEALDLADWLEAVGGGPSAKRCAALLREQHARIAELEAQLESIRAGGVNSPLMGQPQAMPDLTALTEHWAKAWTAVDAQALREGSAGMSKEREAVAQAIWALMREHEDRCDMELEDLGKDHPIWSYAEAARASLQSTGFSAEDMATASAQGFRDGRASLSANAGEPVAWQSRTRPTWGGNTRPWSPWEPCTKEQAEDCWKTPLLHDWAYEARALFTAPQPAPASLSEMPCEKRKAIQEGEQIGASDAWFKARHEMLDTVDRRNVFRAGFDRGWSAALAAQGGK